MSDTQTAAILDLLGKKSTVAVRIGRYVGAQDGQALIDMGDQRFPAAFKSAGFVPQINEPVWVETVDGQMFMTGPTAAKPGVGVVTTVSDPLVTVMTDFGSVIMPYAGVTPASGATVGISWSTYPWCSVLSVSTEQEEAPGAPGSGVQTQSAEFRPIDAGSTDRGSARYWTGRVLASSSTYGAWFYGTQIKDTIPASASLDMGADGATPQLQIYVSWAVRRYGPPRWVLHNLATKSGVLGVSAYTEWDPTRGAGWFTPPDPVGWFNALKGGGAWWGIGFNQGGYEEAKSLVEDGQSGALRIKWKA